MKNYDDNAVHSSLSSSFFHFVFFSLSYNKSKSGMIDIYRASQLLISVEVLSQVTVVVTEACKYIKNEYAIKKI